MAKIRRLEEILAYGSPNNPWVKLFFDKVKFPNGEIGFYNRIVESEGKSGVAVLPLIERKIGLVRQYRYPVNEDLWEIPRGFGESFNPVEDARREFFEETNIDLPPSSFVSLGTVHPNTGILASEVALFLVNCSAPSLQSNFFSDEISELAWMDLEKVTEMIAVNKIRDSFTIVALYRARLLGHL